MILSVLDIIVAVILIGIILLQMQGTGLSSSFGGSGEMFRSQRSAQRLLSYLTIVFTALFAIISILLLIHK